MSIEGSVEFPDAKETGGSGSGANDVKTKTEERTPIIKQKTCLNLYNGYNIYGEIFPWYQFRTIKVTWWSIQVCNLLKCNYKTAEVSYICDQICEKGSYTRIRFSNFEEA